MVKTVLFAALILLLTYLAIGIIKTLFSYTLFYVAWKWNGKKPIRGTQTTVEIDEEGNEVEGREKTEEIIYNSPYEFFTEDIREYMRELLTEKISSALAHDCLYLPWVKRMLLVIQFVTDVLYWPSGHNHMRLRFNKNRSAPE